MLGITVGDLIAPICGSVGSCGEPNPEVFKKPEELGRSNPWRQVKMMNEKRGSGIEFAEPLTIHNMTSKEAENDSS
jgi:hypothetical protein